VTAPNTLFVSFAQNREDVVLFRALKDVTNGFYIDVGAHDPVVESVTKAFYDRGWRGINLEPSTFWYERLTLARPRDINLNLAAWNSPGELSFNDVEGTGLSTVDAEIDARHRALARYTVRDARVRAETLATICRLDNVSEVHFLKIDVEGAEREALQGMDFQSLRPWIVLVEAIDPLDQSPTHDKWEHLLIDAGYEFTLFDGLNRFYCDHRRPGIKKLLQTPANVLDNYIPVRYRLPDPPFPPNFGVNLFGQFSSATGLGVTARHTARAIRAAGVPLACFDIKPYYPTGDVAEELAEIAPHFVSTPSGLRFPVNLYCMPAIDFPLLAQKIPELMRERRFHAAVVWWETTKLNASWAQALIQLDALTAYSEFIAGVLANSLPLTPVVTGRQPLFLPDGIRSDRAAFGLPADATVFVSSFDPSSDPTRKNPVAVINSFRLAFQNNETDVRLIFRLNNAQSTDMARQTTRLLLEAAGGDQRIGFALEPMSYKQVLSLYASADVYVSLHRAEGLGLGMLEAMRLGVPVIATGWSGNMTFMNHRCACLVRYRLVQVSGNHPFLRPEVLGPEAVWAEPVIEDAIVWMRHLHEHPHERRRMGELARLRTERYQEEALALDWLHELAEIWRSAEQLPRVDGKLSTAPTTQ
jgi:FkbM family methyltransferase